MPLNEQEKNRFLADFNNLYALSDDVGMVKLSGIFDVLVSVMDEMLGNDTIFSHSFFSKVSLLKKKLSLPEEISYSLNYIKINYRRIKEIKHISHKELLSVIRLGQHLILYLLNNHYQGISNKDYDLIGEAAWIFPPSKKTYKDSIPFLKGMLIDMDIIHHIIFFKMEGDEIPVQVFFNKIKVNEVYTDSLMQLYTLNKFPISCMLVDIKINDAGGFIPVHFVLEPDYLFDVTTIANCFDWNESNSVRYVLKKFVPFIPSIPLIIGDIANFFLDELVSDASQSFESLFPKIFSKKPLHFVSINDNELADIIKISRNIFTNLIKTITSDFSKHQIIPSYCYVEPAFISEKFGIQGRLDLLFEGSNKTVIVELKGGKTFRTNQYGINIPHFFQFLLYDLLIQSLGKNRKVEGFVLYAADAMSLRYTPVNTFEQQRALALRNELLCIEVKLMALGFESDILAVGDKLVRTWCNQQSKINGFYKRDVEFFVSTLEQATQIEKKYFYSFVIFISR
jgi:DNA replication ATP-dependent helicase Dna2